MHEDIKERIELIRAGKVPEGYKKTKLGILPEDFKIILLGELVDFQNGINAEKEKFGSGIKIISVSDILKEEPIFYDSIQSEIDISEEELENYAVNYGDILFQRSSENIEDAGKANVYLDEKRATFGGFVIRGKKKTDYNPIVINEILKMQRVRKQVMKMAAGAQHINISQDSLKKIWIAIPNAAHQAYVETILKKYIKQTDLLQKKIKLLRFKKIWLMQMLLTGRKRLPEFKDKWKMQQMEKVFDERIEINMEERELLSITSKGILPRSELQGKDNSSDNKSKYKRICKGDIGYNTMRMWQGVSALSEYDGIVSPAYTVLAPHDDVDAKFFSYLFKLPSSIFKFYRYSQGLVDDTRNLKYENFKKISFAYPSDVKEQGLIAEILSKVDEEIKLHEKKLELIKQEKKAMMQLLLTGIVRVSEE